jgi:hypothetical protein
VVSLAGIETSHTELDFLKPCIPEYLFFARLQETGSRVPHFKTQPSHMESNITLYVIFNQALQVEVVQVLASGCFTRNVDRQKPQFFCSVQVKKTLL